MDGISWFENLFCFIRCLIVVVLVVARYTHFKQFNLEVSESRSLFRFVVVVFFVKELAFNFGILMVSFLVVVRCTFFLTYQYHSPSSHSCDYDDIYRCLCISKKSCVSKLAPSVTLLLCVNLFSSKTIISKLNSTKRNKHLEKILTNIQTQLVKIRYEGRIWNRFECIWGSKLWFNFDKCFSYLLQKLTLTWSPLYLRKL